MTKRTIFNRLAWRGHDYISKDQSVGKLKSSTWLLPEKLYVSKSYFRFLICYLLSFVKAILKCILDIILFLDTYLDKEHGKTKKK